MFLQNLIPFRVCIAQNITHDNLDRTDSEVNPVETTTAILDDKMSTDTDEYFEEVNQSDPYLQHESKLNVKKKKFIKRFKVKQQNLLETPDEIFKVIQRY